MNKIGYARVSTEEQILDLQLDALRDAGCGSIFSDRGVCGASPTRDGLDDALEAMDEGDILVVWKLDRLGRSISFLIDLIETLRARGCGFQSLSDGIDTTTSSGKLVFHIMAALAEFERSLIIERTKAGMASAKRRGKHVGRPRALTGQQIRHAKQLIEAGDETLASAASLFGVGKSTLWRALRA